MKNLPILSSYAVIVIIISGLFYLMMFGEGLHKEDIKSSQEIHGNNSSVVAYTINIEILLFTKVSANGRERV